MNTKSNMLQQGDVLLSPVQSIPDACKKLSDKRGVVLAEGEITGHYHGIAESSGVELLEAPDRTRFLRVTASRATLTHQEHKPVTIGCGTYRLGIVREKDWFQDMVRNVVD